MVIYHGKKQKITINKQKFKQLTGVLSPNTSNHDLSPLNRVIPSWHHSVFWHPSLSTNTGFGIHLKLILSRIFQWLVSTVDEIHYWRVPGFYVLLVEQPWWDDGFSSWSWREIARQNSACEKAVIWRAPTWMFWSYINRRAPHAPTAPLVLMQMAWRGPGFDSTSPSSSRFRTHSWSTVCISPSWASISPSSRRLRTQMLHCWMFSGWRSC